MHIMGHLPEVCLGLLESYLLTVMVSTPLEDFLELLHCLAMYCTVSNGATGILLR